MDIEEKNILKLIKAAGYNVTKDSMGTYFDNDKRKFSIIKIGHIYNCYLNEKQDGKYILRDTYNSQILLKQCLYWIINNIDKKFV